MSEFLAKEQLMGQECEFAILFFPDKNSTNHPTNLQIFLCIAESIKSFVQSKPGKKVLNHEFFVENGGSFCYEFLPWSVDDGLIESRTPECGNSKELLLYQRAQEATLRQALPIAEQHLREMGFQGQIDLLKNCKDSRGNIYGTQENYLCSMFSNSKNAKIFKLLVCLFTPILFIGTLTYGIILFFLILLFACCTALFLVSFANILLLRIIFSIIGKIRNRKNKSRLLKIFENTEKNLKLAIQSKNIEKAALQIEYLLCAANFRLYLRPFASLLKRFAFRKQRDQLEAFFATRTIFTGAGTLTSDGFFRLSERAESISTTTRGDAKPAARVIFDTGNLLKQVAQGGIEIFRCNIKELWQITSPQQRLQIGFSDANRCQVAEFLKLGVSSILIEMCDNGALVDAPKLQDPITAIQIVNCDIGMKTKIKTNKGDMRSIDVQKWYLTLAKNYIQQSKIIRVEQMEVLNLWEQVLGILEKDPSKLIGRIDWISKKYLLATAGEKLNYTAQKKIDLAYHQISGGYFNLLEKEKITTQLIEEDTIKKAIFEPASSASVQFRSRLIRDISFLGEKVKVSWDSARIGGWWHSKILHFKKQ